MPSFKNCRYNLLTKNQHDDDDAVCVCVYKVTPVLTSCVIAAAVLLPLGILCVWFIYKLYKYLYPKTNLPEHLKVF